MLARRAGAAVLGLVLLAGPACWREPDEALVTLRVVNWSQDLELQTEQAIAEGFVASHPGVRVVVESVATNYGEKLATAIASGAPPDVLLLDVPDIPAFVERGLLLDLAPFAERVGYDPAAVFPQVLSVFRRGERLYAFPKDFTPMVVYLNRSLFERLGVAEPPAGGWTWEEFTATARDLTRDEDGDGRTDVWAVSFPRQLYEWISFVWSGGADVLGEGGRRASGHLDAPATVAVFEWLCSLVTREAVMPPLQFLLAGDGSRTARFYSGQQAMLISGHWTLPQLRKYAERGLIDVGVAPIPHRSGCAPVTALYTSGWAVPINARHRRLAVELAAFLAGESAQRTRAATGVGIPALAGLAAELGRADASGLEGRFLDLIETGRMPWGAVVRDFHEVERLALDVMDRHLLRGDALDVAASEVAVQIDAVLAR
jgi:multiple sugar transport system substrate-binding protein